jgi:hypothetical protein
MKIWTDSGFSCPVDGEAQPDPHETHSTLIDGAYDGFKICY